MKKLLVLAPLLFSICSFAQKDTVRLTLDEARRMDEKASVLNNTYLIVSDPKTNEIVSESSYLNNKLDGMSTVYHKGKILWRGTFKNGKKDGYYIEYYNNGYIERKETYSAGKVTSGQCFDEKGVEVPYFTQPLTFADKMPKPSFDLDKYLQHQVNYPESARRDNLQGRVVVRFVVMQDGSIYNPIIVRSLSKDCDEEVLRVIKHMPKWEPANQGGEKVNAYYTLPVVFR